MVGQESHTKDRAPEFPKIRGYRIEGVLGRGATGVVYRAVQLAVDRPVALKVLHTHLVGTRRAIGRLQREARTAARLAHPNIIAAIDMGEIDGRWWYAMELVEGESLAERIQRGGRLKEREALRVFIPLCDALQHAFDGGVVHRDIKPANILIDQRGVPRLVDLGLAFAEGDPSLTRTGGTLGTPHYISPEQARDPSSADTRSDIWSLGATLYHALCGRPPFEGGSVAEVLSNVLYERVPDPRQLAPHVSRGFALVVRKCLTHDPNRRYQRPLGLLHDLERIRERRHPDIRISALDPVAGDPRDWLRPSLKVAAGLAVIAATWFATARPWQAGPGGRDILPPMELVWPRTERIGEDFRSGRISHRRALLELGDMDVPGSFAVEWSRVQDSILHGLDVELGELLEETREEVDQHLAQRALSEAEASAGAGFVARMRARTGFGRLADLPAGLRERCLDSLAGLQQQAQSVRDQAIAEAEDALRSHFEALVRPSVEELRDARRWRAAAEVLDRDPRAWLAPAGADLRGLSEREVRSIAQSLDVERRTVGSALRTGCASANGGLIRWTDERAAALRRELLRADTNDVSDALVRDFDNELARRGIERAELPKGWGDASLRHLAAVARDLQDREQKLIEVEARRSFSIDTARVETFCRRRAYPAAIEYWKDRIADPRRRSELAGMRARLRECELLRGLLERAAAGVRQRSGTEFDAYFDSILVRGRVEAGSDPLRRGFDLVDARRRQRVYLVRPAGQDRQRARVLRTRDLEILAGLEGAQLDVQGAALRSLFRYYEGDYEGALESLPMKGGSGDSALEDLRARVLDALDERSAIIRQRAEDLASRMENVRRDFREYGLSRPDKLLADVEAIQSDFADLLDVDERRELRFIEEELERGPSVPTLKDAFRPDQLTSTPPRNFSMAFFFDGDRVGTWDPGVWRAQPGGWVLPESMADAAHLIAAGKGPNLALREPLDPEDRLRIAMVFEPVVRADDEPNILLLSMAGFHAAFVSAYGSGGGPRFLIDTTSVHDVFQRLLEGDSSAFDGFRGFEPGRPFELEFEINPKGGTVGAVLVDGRPLRAQHQYVAPDLGRPESLELSVRALHPLRLREVRLAGKRVPR